MAATIAMTCASTAGAQSSAPIDPGRFEVGVGLRWTGRASFGSREANETTSAGTPSTIFTTSSELASASGIEGRAGIHLTRRLRAEAAGSYGTPQFVTRVTLDIESSTPVRATERIQEFTIQGAMVWDLAVPRLGARTTPFVSAGAGYLRQLHAGGVLAASGQVYEIGGGVKHLVVSRDHARLKGIGVRADARVVARAKGVAIDRRTHLSPVLGASIFIRL